MADRVTGHRLLSSGPPGTLSAWRWWCECGHWRREGTPAVGPYGATTAKARIAQVGMAHGKHARAAAHRTRRAAAAVLVPA